MSRRTGDFGGFSEIFGCFRDKVTQVSKVELGDKVEDKVEDKVDKSTLGDNIPNYCPASSAGLSPCAKRITPLLTPFINSRKFIQLYVEKALIQEFFTIFARKTNGITP